MRKAWLVGSGVAAAVLALMLCTPLRAADDSGVRPVAETLGQRTKPPKAQTGGLSDSSVRVMSLWAWSIMPENYEDPNGNKVVVDKANRDTYIVPPEDARRVIRTAMRSAYADACDLPELGVANFQTMMRGEEARNAWTREQLLFINFLHTFAVSYFTGNFTMTEEGGTEASDGADTAATAPAAANAQTGEQPDGFTPKKLVCTPEQKEKVTQAITAYVQAAKTAAPPKVAPPPEAAAPAQAVPRASQNSSTAVRSN